MITSTTLSTRRKKLWLVVAFAAVLTLVVTWIALVHRGSDGVKSARGTESASVKPALTVTVTKPQTMEWAQVLPANGNIMAWEESIIGAEISNLRLTEVLVNVGDRVRKGQVLARFASDIVAAELAQSQALLVEAGAMLAEARANAERARQMQALSFFSAQQIKQYLTVEEAALARLKLAQAKVRVDELRFSQTRVLAPDDGIVSARTAAVGSLGQPGEELFRVIRGGRLEWRAEVTEADLGKLKPGMTARLVTADGSHIVGRVRMAAPTVDPKTRIGLVYVDLPVAENGSDLRAGAFTRGEFELGWAAALTLPQSAVMVRDGFSYVFRLEGTSSTPILGMSKVILTKVSVGRRSGERIEITSGLDPGVAVVNSGGAFLSDGDVVQVVELPRATVEAER